MHVGQSTSGDVEAAPPLTEHPSGESREAAIGLEWDRTSQRYIVEPDHEHHHPLAPAVHQQTELSREEKNVDAATVVQPADEKKSVQDGVAGAGADSEEPPADDDPIYIEFEENDPENPFNWDRRRKWVVSLVACFYGFSVAFTGSSFPVGIPSMRAELHCSQEVALFGLALYPLGFGIAPLALAPFSEAYGRNPMYFWTALIYTLFTVLVGKAPNIAAVMVGRFISGCAGSCGSTMVGGTMADLWLTHERGVPMALFSVAAFLGTGIGPATMGYVAQNVGWRWVQYVQAISGAAMYGAFWLCMRETRGSIILSRRAARLRKETGDSRYRCKADEERAGLVVLVTVSLSRPLYFLFTEPVVFFFALWVSFAWGVMYGLLEALPLTMTTYGFNEGQIGLSFLSLAIGGAIAMLLNPLQEKAYARNVAKRGPEARLYGAAIGGILLPIGCMIFAWTEQRTHWIAPLIGVVILMAGIFWIYTAGFNYLADAYLAYASSAIAAQSFARNMMGFAYPLFTTQMYDRLGYDWASFLFGMIALVLAVIPFVLFFKGPEIRARSKFVKEMERILRQKQ